MDKIFTLSAYQTSAEQFFKRLIECHTDLVLDVRLKNTSQLCGFTKKGDLEYLIPAICHASYIADLFFAPSAQLLNSYTHHRIDWKIYFSRYGKEQFAKNSAAYFKKQYADKYKNICLLGTATDKRRSHTEILEKMLQNIKI